MKLSKNFQLSEFTKSKTAIKFGINNEPNETQLTNISYLVNKGLQPLRTALGSVSISSGLRVPELNKQLGGSTTSFHCHGQAADLDNDKQPASAASNEELFFYIYHNLPYTELIWEFGDGINPAWVHYALAKGREQEKETLIAYKDNKKTHYVEFSLDNLELYLG